MSFQASSPILLPLWEQIWGFDNCLDFFFLPAVVCAFVCVCVCACARVKKNRFCPGGNGEEGRRELHFQGQRLGSRFPEVTQTHHSDNSHCNFIFIPLEK